MEKWRWTVETDIAGVQKEAANESLAPLELRLSHSRLRVTWFVTRQMWTATRRAFGQLLTYLVVKPTVFEHAFVIYTHDYQL